MTARGERATDLGRLVTRLVAAALSVAALAAIVAILSEDFTDGDLRVIGTSVLFAVATATAGAGAALRLRGTSADAALGGTVVAASAVTFALVTYGMWADTGGDAFWQVAGVAGIVALDGAHACFVLARRRDTDPGSVRSATTAAVSAAATSGTLGVLAVTGLVHDGPWQLLAVVLVVQLLGTALALLLRRAGRDDAPAPAGPFGPVTDRTLADELRLLADALDAAASPTAVRDLAQRLRELARRA